MGDAFAEYADARYCDSLSRHVSSGRNKYFRRPWHNAPVRDFRRTVYSSRILLQRAQRTEITRRFFSRELFPADFSEVRWRTVWRCAVTRDGSKRVPTVSNGR